VANYATRRSDRDAAICAAGRWQLDGRRIGFRVARGLEYPNQSNIFEEQVMNMSRFLKTIVLPSCIVIAAAGCSTRLVPFTHDMREQYGISDADLQNLQFFVSNDVILQEYQSDTLAGVTPKHTIRVNTNSEIEEVKIDSKTPGIAESVGPYSLKISFDPGRPECLLEFGNVSKNGNYSLFARNWSDYIGEVDYCGQQYHAVRGSNNAHLLVDYAVLSKFIKSSETLKGRKF
jgi:hypothetical protein